MSLQNVVAAAAASDERSDEATLRELDVLFIDPAVISEILQYLYGNSSSVVVLLETGVERAVMFQSRHRSQRSSMDAEMCRASVHWLGRLPEQQSVRIEFNVSHTSTELKPLASPNHMLRLRYVGRGYIQWSLVLPQLFASRKLSDAFHAFVTKHKQLMPAAVQRTTKQKDRERKKLLTAHALRATSSSSGAPFSTSSSTSPLRSPPTASNAGATRKRQLPGAGPSADDANVRAKKRQQTGANDGREDVEDVEDEDQDVGGGEEESGCRVKGDAKRGGGGGDETSLNRTEAEEVDGGKIEASVVEARQKTRADAAEVRRKKAVVAAVVAAADEMRPSIKKKKLASSKAQQRLMELSAHTLSYELTVNKLKAPNETFVYAMPRPSTPVVAARAACVVLSSVDFQQQCAEMAVVGNGTFECRADHTALTLSTRGHTGSISYRLTSPAPPKPLVRESPLCSASSASHGCTSISAPSPSPDGNLTTASTLSSVASRPSFDGLSHSPASFGGDGSFGVSLTASRGTSTAGGGVDGRKRKQESEEPRIVRLCGRREIVAHHFTLQHVFFVLAHISYTRVKTLRLYLVPDVGLLLHLRSSSTRVDYYVNLLPATPPAPLYGAPPRLLVTAEDEEPDSIALLTGHFVDQDSRNANRAHKRKSPHADADADADMTQETRKMRTFALADTPPVHSEEPVYMSRMTNACVAPTPLVLLPTPRFNIVSAPLAALA
jgi:hypothetical protein